MGLLGKGTEGLVKGRIGWVWLDKEMEGFGKDSKDGEG